MNMSSIIGRTVRWSMKGLFLLLLAAPLATVLVQRANAQQAPSWYDPEQRGAKILGHVSIDVSHFKDAVFLEREDRRYLYVQNIGSQQVAIIDVTSRRKPKMAGSIDLPTDAKLSQIAFKGDVAIVMDAKGSGTSTGPQPADTNSPVQNITVWDLSKPGTPQVSQHFTGVKKIISGRANVVYVVDSRGLWIVQIYDQQMRDWDYYVDHIAP